MGGRSPRSTKLRSESVTTWMDANYGTPQVQMLQRKYAVKNLSVQVTDESVDGKPAPPVLPSIQPNGPHGEDTLPKTTVASGLDSGGNKPSSGKGVVKPTERNKISLLQKEVIKWGRDFANLETANTVLGTQLVQQQEENDQRLLSMQKQIRREKRRVDKERAHMSDEIARQVEEGIRRFRRSIPPQNRSEPSETSPRTSVATNVGSKVQLDSLGSHSSASLVSNRTRRNERNRSAGPVYTSGGSGSQGVPVAMLDGTANIPNQMVQETFQHVNQLQAAEAERIRSQAGPYASVALDLRENEPGDSVQRKTIPTPPLATGGQVLALAKYQPTQALMAAAGGAGDPENDPNNPRGRGQGRRGPATPVVLEEVETLIVNLLMGEEIGIRRLVRST